MRYKVYENGTLVKLKSGVKINDKIYEGAYSNNFFVAEEIEQNASGLTCYVNTLFMDNDELQFIDISTSNSRTADKRYTIHKFLIEGIV